MRSKFIGVASLALALAACGGGKDPLAELCVDETAKRLEGQVYRLDEKGLVFIRLSVRQVTCACTAQETATEAIRERSCRTLRIDS